MDSASYPAGPAAVPADLTRPTKAYKQHAWIAVGVLTLFVVLYVFLSGWFAWSAWRLLKAAAEGGQSAALGAGVGICSAFLAVFMLKALFFVKQGGKIEDVEITAAEQPRLFGFLHRLADEAGAPRPHRVFLSARVNASVFYDLSILNLIFPSRKNLEIGLGLVNVLNIGEFKAVCAHEFGHFAQRSMAVGRWVYIAQQIAAHIVAKRDALDSFLDGLSRVDLRIAWIGWILRLIVWSLRSLLDTAFTAVVLAQRSLSRDMEMQADLVAVSLTGSDALIHALHRLQVADDAWDRTVAFVNGELADKRAPKDVLALQTHIIAGMGELLNVPGYGQPPATPAADPAAHRLFKAEIAQPPRMWSTHPLNHEREENAKRVYLPAEGDARSAWTLFDEVETVREKVTVSLFNPAEMSEVQSVPTEDALTRLDEQFKREHLRRAYRGVYYGRSAVRAAATSADLYNPQAGAAAHLAALYPESLAADLEQVASLEKEKALLESLRDGHSSAPGGVIRHRGTNLKPGELPQAIAAVQGELNAVQGKISAHDRLCRTAHRAAAASLGQGWEAYLGGLAGVLHYADHTAANLRDAKRRLNNVVAVTTAAGRVSSGDRKRIVKESGDLFVALNQVFDQRGQLQADARLLARMEIASWDVALGELGLRPPTEENIGDWLKVSESWVAHACNILAVLARHALEELLLGESRVAGWHRTGSADETAPAPSRTPADYPVLLPGHERKLQTRLGWWARFQTADGIIPSLARFAVAAGIVGSVLIMGNQIGSAAITVYNGLARDVRIEAGASKISLRAHSFGTVEVPPQGHQRIRASTTDGREIESFEVDLSRSFSTYIYNVAGASPLAEWTAVYGNVAPIPDRPLGAPRWSTSSADHIFGEPPKQISTKHGGGTRSVLSGAPSTATPGGILETLANDSDRKAMIKVHARWDSAQSPYMMQWLGLAAMSGEQADIIAARLKDNPNEIVSRRAEQDAAAATDAAAHARVCAAHNEMARAEPDNGDLQYLVARCVDGKADKEQAFVEAHKKWPRSGWLAYAAGYSYARSMRWPEAMAAWSTARTSDTALASIVSVDLARARRLQDGNKTVLNDLLPASTALRQMLNLEQDRDVGDGVGKAYVALGRGKLEQAVQMSQKTPDEARVLRLAACSDGADSRVVRRALSLPTNQGVDESTLPFALALASREKADPAAYAEALRREEPANAETLLTFVALAQAGKTDEADQVLIGLEPKALGQAWGMGAILLGNAAPKAWREGAKRLLFAPERPWFM